MFGCCFHFRYVFYKSGKFNRELAQSIISTREFSDAGKESLQHIIDLYDEAEKAWQEVTDWLTGIFGDLGSTLSDALSDAFRNGTDAAQVFGDSVKSMLENLGKQMIFSTLFSDILQDANKKMQEVMRAENMTDEERFNSFTSILDGMTSDVMSKQEDYNALMEQYKQIGEKYGISLFDRDKDSEKAATGGYSAQLSEDTGTEINGRLTAVQDSNERIAQSIEINLKYLDSLVTGVGDVNTALTDILTQHTRTNEYLEEISGCVQELKKFDKKLDKIVAYTKESL